MADCVHCGLDHLSKDCPIFKMTPEREDLEPEGKIAKLSVVQKPKASDEARAQVVALLRLALAEAEAGEVSEIIMILDRPGNVWSESMSSTSNFAAVVGRLEIVKQRWVEDYLRQCRQCPVGHK